MGPAAAIVLAGAAAVVAPAVGAGTRGRLALGIPAAVVLLAGSPLGVAVLPLAGFALCAAALGRAFAAARLPGAAAAGLAGLLACGVLVLPFVGDPLVEPGGPGRGSPAAIDVLVKGSPLCASVGGGLGVDLLHGPRAYGGAGGGLSRIGAYYAYAYPGPVAAGAAWAVAGILLAAGAGLARRRREP